jgi:hypothetical protein
MADVITPALVPSAAAMVASVPVSLLTLTVVAVRVALRFVLPPPPPDPVKPADTVT